MSKNEAQDARVAMTVEGLKTDFEWHVRHTVSTKLSNCILLVYSQNVQSTSLSGCE